MPSEAVLFVGFIFLFGISMLFIVSRYRRCPSDKILVVYGKISKTGDELRSAKCYHGGAAFILPVFQGYQYLDLTPNPIEINLQVNTPSTFTVGISTETSVMGNAAERLLGLPMKEVHELARDIIFGQMRVVIATMTIEEINTDREKLIGKITAAVEDELNKVGLHLINVNIQDITDESGYIAALGKEAAARAINEAKKKVAEQVRDGEVGKAHAERDQRVEVAGAHATAVEGENTAGIKIARSNAARREQEAEAERLATAAEKVKHAQALQESYAAEEAAEIERAKRESATQEATKNRNHGGSRRRKDSPDEAGRSRRYTIAHGSRSGRPEGDSHPQGGGIRTDCARVGQYAGACLFASGYGTVAEAGGRAGQGDIQLEDRLRDGVGIGCQRQGQDEHSRVRFRFDRRPQECRHQTAGVSWGEGETARARDENSLGTAGSSTHIRKLFEGTQEAQLMVLYVMKYDLRPERTNDYINISALERIRAIPGLVELRAYRPVAGSHQIVVTYEFADMAAFAAYVSHDDFHKLMMEVRAFVTNVSTEVWGPSLLAPKPIRS
jgi:regulator of protease activity HflC (stomatin/prohibitin superfamily)/heme-degrading monooxygenase HmoA